MAYRFLVDSDFDMQILSQLVRDRNAQDLNKILEDLEAKAISIVSAKLTGRYDLDAVFDAAEVDRHHLIVHFVLTITIYYFLRRNAARKVPSDYRDDYMDVMKALEKIQAGKLTPDGLPKPTDENGDVVTKPIIASRKNNDYYI